MTTTRRLIDPTEIRRAFTLLTQPGQVIEVRALEATSRTDRYPATYSGYFNNSDRLLSALSDLREASGIYMTLQPCLPALLSRASNKLLRQKKSGGSTSDRDITRYAWLPIDSDPERPSQISSTDAEHEYAHHHSRLIRDVLRDMGWPDPIFADSGNGSHLLYRIDLATSESELVKRVLEGLAEMCQVEGVHVDTTLYNPSRILKLYGTLACKGDDTPERPYRMSHILEAPEDMQIVPKEMLEAVAIKKEDAPQTRQRQAHSASGYDLRNWLREYNIETYGEEAWQGHARWKLKQCPFCQETDRGAVLLLFQSGAVSFKCHHQRCQGKNWQDFRSHYEPDAYVQAEQASGKNVLHPYTFTNTPLGANPGADECKEMPPCAGDIPIPMPLYGLPGVDLALRTRDRFALYGSAGDIVQLTEVAQKRLRLDVHNIFGRDFPMREFDDLLRVEQQRLVNQRHVTSRPCTVKELMKKEFPQINWAVPGILPQGLIALAGKQKIGKSWLDYHLALAVASGGLAFGQIPVTRGSVLYLALEDNEQCMQARWQHLLAPGEEAPENLYYATEWPRMDSEGLGGLEEWIVEHPDARLIIIDPWVKVKPLRPLRAGETGYDLDYEALTGLKLLADKYRITILTQFHLRKASAEDPFDELNGTSGVTACADGFLSLKRRRTRLCGGRDANIAARSIWPYLLKMASGIYWAMQTPISSPKPAKRCLICSNRRAGRSSRGGSPRCWANQVGRSAACCSA